MTCGRCVGHVDKYAYELDERHDAHVLDERDETNAAAIVMRMSLAIHKLK